MKIASRPAGLRQWFLALIRLVIFILVLMSGIFLFTDMPGTSFTGPLPPLTAKETHSAALLKAHVLALARDIGPRTIFHSQSMERTVAYLESELTDLGYEIRRHEYPVRQTVAVNLEIEIPGTAKADEIVIVGAHYDTVFHTPGANDNASGVAALLELARLLTGSQPVRTIRLVAFANEEPPFYLSREMGSRQYAARCKKEDEKVVGMLALETIGFYTDEPRSQKYPFPFSVFYPKTGNFIGFVANFHSRELVYQTIKVFRDHCRFPSEGIAAPGFITGIGWSDHWSFWQEGYPALMVTDTAFFRYEHYHTRFDTPNRLDYERLARVVHGLVPTILELAR